MFYCLFFLFLYKAKAEPINTSIAFVEPATPVLTFDLLISRFILLPIEPLTTEFVFGTNFHFPVKIKSPFSIVPLSLSYPSNTQVPSFTLTSNLEGFVGETLVPFSIPS